MCTVTWLHSGEHYRLFCNRDELRTRKAAQPPTKHRCDGALYLAPVDGDAGGTWIAVNDHGLALCLLNDYRSPIPDHQDFISRGQLVTDLISASDLTTLERCWRETALGSYRPFALLALAPFKSAQLFAWNGVEASHRLEGVEPPLSSSSFDDEMAASERQKIFARYRASGLPDLTRLHRFHSSHLPERGPFSVCMHRPDALTVSFCIVTVDKEEVAMAYAPGPPCSTPLEVLTASPRSTTTV